MLKNNLMDKKTFDAKVKDKYIPVEGMPEKRCSHNPEGFPQFVKNKYEHRESSLHMKNAVYLVVIKDYILILKEKWENWVFLE